MPHSGITLIGSISLLESPSAGPWLCAVVLAYERGSKGRQSITELLAHCGHGLADGVSQPEVVLWMPADTLRCQEDWRQVKDWSCSYQQVHLNCLGTSQWGNVNSLTVKSCVAAGEHSYGGRLLPS